MASLRQLFGWQASYASLRPGLLAALAVLVPLLSACESKSLIPSPAENPGEVYWSLELNHHAVTLSTTAPYDTLTVTATPRNSRNEPLTGLPQPTYVSRDVERVLVTPEGTLVAVAPMAAGTQVRIAATLSVGNITHQDSVWVTVVDNSAPPVLGALSAEPIPPDSAKIPASSHRVVSIAVIDTLPAWATDVTGAPMTGILMSFRSSDPTRVRFVNEMLGQPQALTPGTADVYVSATAFGVHRADTVTYRIGYPVWASFEFHSKPEDHKQVEIHQSELRIGTGGAVFFNGGYVDTVAKFDITFDDPESAISLESAPIFATPPNAFFPLFCQFKYFECDKGGNVMFDENSFIAPDGVYLYKIRVFPTPGTYEFHSISAGFRGRVIVMDER